MLVVWLQRQIELRARPRGFHLVTDEIAGAVPELSQLAVGIATVFMQHTSASLTLNENASPDVRRDFAEWFDRAVPDGADYFSHTLEGPDDMPAHIKASLTDSSLVIPIARGSLALGTWQGIYLCEHRDRRRPAPSDLHGLRRGEPADRSSRGVCEHVFVMRWDNLKVDAEDSRTLPGYREPATVRTFDAPEALDTRFYEVRSKSALNKVPKASRMPFRWTINPYRGCSHACTYCAGGDTEILMADGRTTPLAEIRPGDRIYGTGPGRPVSPIRGHDGARPLVDDQARVPGRPRRRHGNHLQRRSPILETAEAMEARHGRRVRRPSPSPPDAQRQADGSWTPCRCAGPQRRVPAGYLCGMIRGDGTLGSRDYLRRNGKSLDASPVPARSR